MNEIICETTEEQASTTFISTPTETGHPVPNATPQPIQGVTGASYAPMDTNPMTPEQQQNARVKMLMEMLTTALNGLVKELQTPTQPQTDLEEAVSTTLEQADWFTEKLNSTVQDSIDDKDFEYEINNAVEQELRNIDINDYVDFDEMVRDVVDDKLEDILTEKLEELLEEKLKNATINISF